MLRITHIEPEPLERLRYRNVPAGGGTETQLLCLERAAVTGLPEALDALVIASDLQGLGFSGELLGVEVAAALEPHTTARTAVLLAGDLYSVANKRGGFGDVAPVWRAFASRFAWVAGVAGNHDDVSGVSGPNVHLLDGDLVERDGLTVAGVGLICGNPNKPGRRAEDEQLARIERVLERSPDVLLLHEGPAGAPQTQPGHPRIAPRAPLTVCGHVHWKQPLHAHAHGQTLNADGRVLLLTRSAE